MKIAYPVTCTVPSREASSIHVMKMCNALAGCTTFAGQGNEVTLIVPDFAEIEPGVDDVFSYYGVPESFQIKKIKLKLDFIPFFKGVRRSLKIARYIASGRFDYVLGRETKNCFFIANIFRKPVICELHKPLPDKWEELYFKLLIKSKYFKRLIVITEALKQYYASQYGIDGEKIYVAADGADEVHDEGGKSDGVLKTAPGSGDVLLTEKSGGKFNVGYIGHLYKGRGIELLGEIAEGCPFAFFHIIGGKEADIEKWKEKYKDIENIHFYGFVPPKQTASYGKCMDALVAPYQQIVYTAGTTRAEHGTSKWMSPLKIFEYMALGKPIICSDMPVLREVMTDGVNGILCTPDDAGAWCRAITVIYEDKDLAMKLAENARTEFSKYTWRARAENIIELIMIDLQSGAA